MKGVDLPLKNNIEILGKTTVVFIKLKNGLVLETLIDTEDYEKISQYTWSSGYSIDCDCYYARTYIKRKQVYLHRLITNPPDGLYVDHINHNTLDNRKSNLRTATNSQNQQNKLTAPRTNKTSGLRGVSWNKQKKKWYAYIQIDKKMYSLGFYNDLQ
ncbi:MAG: Pathosis-related transcriptional factor and protein [Paenibacillus sp.]|nr:Pathosis-related transcriptional factor and protein [Paenibacillus sp.]